MNTPKYTNIQSKAYKKEYLRNNVKHKKGVKGTNGTSGVKKLSITKRITKHDMQKPGLSPGTLVPPKETQENINNNIPKKTILELIDYTENDLLEREISSIDEVLQYRDNESVTWLNITGLQDTKLIEEIQTKFNIHPLICEDILSTNQRPKIEIFDDYIVVIVHMLTLKEDILESDQVSIIIGKHYLLSFKETPADIFSMVKQRIRNGKGRIRKNTSDYLAYALIDIIIDNYFTVLEKISDSMELLEDGLITNPSHKTLQTIIALKHELLLMRKSIWPLREVINRLNKSETSLITSQTEPFIRDLYDHTIQIIDTIETLRDFTSGMVDLHLSSASNRMNQIMKVLTIISTIFIPLTFLAGLYGMNFQNLPELRWQYGYFVLLGFMFVLSCIMMYFFYKKGWLTNKEI